MGDRFQLADARAAEDFLHEFPVATRRRGYTCDLEAFRLEDNGTTCICTVRDGAESYQAHLFYDNEEGWEGGCSCGYSNCAHVFGAMTALLAENRAEIVRRLSAGDLLPPPALSAIQKRGVGGESGSELARRLCAAVARPLKREESNYIKRVREVYTRCLQIRQITGWEFKELDLEIETSWRPLQIWPSLPANDYEFWLYVANTADERGIAIPEFMQPVTDLSEIRPRVLKWRRSLEIERWRTTLSMSLPPLPLPSVGAAETDLRLVIEDDEARLQWKRPGQDEFEWLKPAHTRHLTAQNEGGTLRFTPEGQLFWHFIEQQVMFGNALRFRYHIAEDARKLARLLRLEILASRIVTSSGEVLPRPVEPLKWNLLEATGDEDDYRVRLAQANGQPLPPLLCVLEGEPTLYLTGKALFTGPRSSAGLLDTRKENRIPAPVVESPVGIGFLKTLGLEPPARVRDRLRVVPYQAAIRCELQKTYLGSASEECLFTVLAEADGGPRLSWTGYNWLDVTPAGQRRRLKDEKLITVHDKGVLTEAQQLIEPLNLKSTGYAERLTLRVTRKFPELFAAWIKTVPPHISLHLDGDLISLASGDVAGSVKLNVSEAEIDWFDLRVVLDVSDTTLSAEEIRLLLNAKGGFVRLAGKGWRRLKFDLTQEDDERLARLGLSPRELTAEPQRLHALQLADDSANKFLPAEQADAIRRRAEEIKARVAPELPPGITAQLRPYQLEGYHFLAYLATNRFGGILADDMGLGKTLQTLAWLLWLRSNPFGSNGTQGSPSSAIGAVSLRPSLVVCPKSVMDNWHAEAARFTPGLRVRPWPALELARLPGELDSADLHVINYSQLRILGESLVPVRWLALILDEGQYIKNPSSQTAQVARALPADHRLILSGTPIENRLLDLWSLMAFAMPGVLGSRAQFAKIYDAKGDPFARRRLAARVRPFVVRRTKTQVAKDLPDRIEEDLFCEIEGEQKTLYRAELKHAQQILLSINTQKELAQKQFHFLTSMLRLRQICCHPALVKPDSTAPSAKTEALLEQLEPLMEEGEKVLIFSQFVEMLNLLRPALEARKWPIFYLAGATENRGDLVREFQAAEGAAVFLISLKAGGFGLNLTAASYVVVFDPWWNPAVENQAIDRTHRIGQSKNVIAYRLLIKNSIEEKIRALQKQKKSLAEDVLGEAKFAQNLTLDDLRFLFAD